MTRLSLRPVTVLVLTCLIGLSACAGEQPQAGSGADAEEAPLLVAAFYPLEFVAQRVAGEGAELTGLTPAGVEPHDLELTANQIRTLQQADLVIYVGEGFQPAVESALDEVDVETLDVLAGADLIEGSDEHEGEDEGQEHEGEEHEGEEHDPHVWLDPTQMARIARSVEQSLTSVDPENSADFKQNSDRLVSELEALDEEFGSGLAQCDRRVLVTSHNAFGYLADRYELEQHGIAGLDPESEPSPQRLAEVTDLVKEEGVTTIFFETLLPPALAETIARETGTTTAVLDPLESKPQTGDYFSAMRANLTELRKALGCR